VLAGKRLLDPVVQHRLVDGGHLSAGFQHARPGALVGRSDQFRHRSGPPAFGHHLHHMIAARFEFLEDHRQRHCGGRVDVVQQQDAAALRLQPADRPFDDLLRADAAEPVVGDYVRAPGHQMLRGQETLVHLGTAEAGNPEERRHGFRVADRGVDRGDPAFDLLLDPRQAQALEAERMIETVRADRMALVVHAPQHPRVGMRHLADNEISRLHALRGERIEDEVAVGRQRAVVEGDHHLMIGERQRLLVLHAADAREFVRTDGEHARGAERVAMAGTDVVRQGRTRARDQQ